MSKPTTEELDELQFGKVLHKRPHQMDLKERPAEDLKAGDDFRRSLLERADAWKGPAPLWHGWAIMDAFLAGIDHATRKRS
jgi:hypothetical protein